MLLAYILILNITYVSPNLVFLCLDGNTKDSIRVTRNMIYNYEAEKSKEIPDLQTFLSDLATDT